jgi:hypothetical protein
MKVNRTLIVLILLLLVGSVAAEALILNYGDDTRSIRDLIEGSMTTVDGKGLGYISPPDSTILVPLTGNRDLIEGSMTTVDGKGLGYISPPDSTILVYSI